MRMTATTMPLRTPMAQGDSAPPLSLFTLLAAKLVGSRHPPLPHTLGRGREWASCCSRPGLFCWPDQGSGTRGGREGGPGGHAIPRSPLRRRPDHSREWCETGVHRGVCARVGRTAPCDVAQGHHRAITHRGGCRLLNSGLDFVPAPPWMHAKPRHATAPNEHTMPRPHQNALSDRKALQRRIVERVPMM